jgi:hypothetical protein
MNINIPLRILRYFIVISLAFERKKALTDNSCQGFALICGGGLLLVLGNSRAEHFALALGLVTLGVFLGQIRGTLECLGFRLLEVVFVLVETIAVRLLPSCSGSRAVVHEPLAVLYTESGCPEFLSLLNWLVRHLVVFLVRDEQEMVVLVLLATLLPDAHVLGSVTVALQVPLELGQEGGHLFVVSRHIVAFGVTEIHSCNGRLAI